MAGEDSSSSDIGNPNVQANPPSTPDSPTSVGFNTDQLPFNTSRTSDDEDEAAVDPEIIRDEADDVDDEEEEGEDLFNDNYMDDYRRMEEHDQYEQVGHDESLEDERDLDQIIADRRAAEIELNTRDGRSTQRKLPQLLHDQGLSQALDAYYTYLYHKAGVCFIILPIANTFRPSNKEQIINAAI